MIQGIFVSAMLIRAFHLLVRKKNLFISLETGPFSSRSFRPNSKSFRPNLKSLRTVSFKVEVVGDVTNLSFPPTPSWRFAGWSMADRKLDKPSTGFNLQSIKRHLNLFLVNFCLVKEPLSLNVFAWLRAQIKKCCCTRIATKSNKVRWSSSGRLYLKT